MKRKESKKEANKKNQDITIDFKKLIPILKLGDIILVRHSAKLSGIDKLVKKFFYWSHAVMYTGNNEVIESSYGGVKKTQLKYYLNNKGIENLAVLRVKEKDKLKNIDDGIAFAESKIGVPYDKWSKIHITKQFDPPKNHPGYGYYCTELIWAAYKKIGLNLDPNKIGWITPLGIYLNKKLKKIYINNKIEIDLNKLSQCAARKQFESAIKTN